MSPQDWRNWRKMVLWALTIIALVLGFAAGLIEVVKLSGVPMQ